MPTASNANQTRGNGGAKNVVVKAGSKVATPFSYPLVDKGGSKKTVVKSSGKMRSKY
jgi:hypothetical protein